jgi:hypothetical protein
MVRGEWVFLRPDARAQRAGSRVARLARVPTVAAHHRPRLHTASTQRRYAAPTLSTTRRISSARVTARS